MEVVYTVGDRCPLGCPWVILVERVTDGRVFAWCTCCGCAWADPLQETWLPGDLGSAEIYATTIADGSAIALATQDDVVRCNLTTIARPVAPVGDWPSYCLDDFNDRYGCDRRSHERSARPKRRWWRLW